MWTNKVRCARISAAAGAVVWLLLLLTTTSDSRETEIIHKVVFLGMLVIVPLGLSLVPIDDERRFYRLAVLVQPIIAGLSGRVLATRNYPRKMFAASVFAIVAAMPLVAAGITFSPWLGFIGALLISIGLLLLALLTFGWVIPAVLSLAGRVLLAVGALSTCAAMVLACLYAYSLATKTLIIDIPTMAVTHGLLNAFGFVTSTLLAWTVITLRSRANVM